MANKIEYSVEATQMDNLDDVEICDLNQVLSFFAQNMYKAKDDHPLLKIWNRKVIKLISIDYRYSVISNNNGELSMQYPKQLVILEHDISEHLDAFNYPFSRHSCSEYPGTIYENINDTSRLKDAFAKARFARCRARFPAPVILFRGKHICRSATISGGPEIYGRFGMDYFFSGNKKGTTETTADEDSGESSLPEEIVVPETQSEWVLFDKVRSQDIRLLKLLNVGTIIDLMLEKKKVKYGVNVTSSEKVDKEKRYNDFTLLGLPYPGCEMFSIYKENNYAADGLLFGWNQSYVDAEFSIPFDPISSQLLIHWNEYQNWDLIKLTQNYLKLILRYVQESKSGMLIHCISGWDRTPLYISLLRLSLWADGLIHKSLSPLQILFLTIMYDWLLFGHDLQDRLTKGEEIFFFCFYFLKYMDGEDFSIGLRHRHRSERVKRNDSEPNFESVLFERQGSGKGSNSSLNSSSSSVSSKSSSKDQPPILFHASGLEEDAWHNSLNHGLPQSNCSKGLSDISEVLKNVENASSPLPVPGQSLNFMKDSSSSNSSSANQAATSIGSWQVVNGCGSVRESTNSNSSSHSSNSFKIGLTSSVKSSKSGLDSMDSSCTLIEDDNSDNALKVLQEANSGKTEILNNRKDKLNSVRSLFYNYYSASIGFNSNLRQGDPISSGLGNLFGNFAQKVGIRSTNSKPTFKSYTTNF